MVHMTCFGDFFFRFREHVDADYYADENQDGHCDTSHRNDTVLFWELFSGVEEVWNNRNNNVCLSISFIVCSRVIVDHIQSEFTL